MEPQSVRKTFKYKLKPTPEQERVLERTLMLCRHVYNAAIGSAEAWQNVRRLGQLLPAEGRIARHQGGDAGVCRGQRPGLAGCGLAGRPRLPGVLPPRQRRARHRAIRAFMGATATTASPIRRSASMAARRWTAVFSASPRSGASPCACTARWRGRPRPSRSSREADGWYACISCADVPVQPLPATGQETGIDLGIEAFATLSDGDTHLHSRLVSQGRARAENRPTRVTRAQEGQQPPPQGGHTAGEGASEGAAPATGLSPQDGAWRSFSANDTIYHEALQPANMVKNHHLAKSISDAGWGAFLIILTHKAACAGRRVVAVNPAYTSQTCSGCGVLVSKGLSVRWHSCPDVRNQPASRPQRGEEHRAAGQSPSGRRGVGRVGEPRSPWL